MCLINTKVPRSKLVQCRPCSGIGGFYELEQKLEDNSIHDEVGENYQQVES